MMKFLLSTVLLAALANAAPNPEPHRHLSDSDSVNVKGAASQYTDASLVPCIDQLECYTEAKYAELSASLTCAWPKIPRYDNDGSCHRCPSLTCQYIFGNKYGNFVPCRNAGNVGSLVTPPQYKARVGGSIVVENIVVNGVGQALVDPVLGIHITDQSTGGNVKFCDDDVTALEKFNIAQGVYGQCGPWHVATIVSPANCHHCQKIRCMAVYQLYRYKEFMNSINLVSNGQGLDFIGTGVDTLNDNYEKVHAHFYCGIIGSDNNYQVLHHFCVDSTTHGYIANSITGDMDLTCGVGQTIVTSASIPSGLKSASNVLVTPWLTNVDAGGAVDANDAGCASVQAFTNAATYILDINSPQWQIVVPYPSV